MKKVVSILSAALLLSSLAAIPASAAGANEARIYFSAEKTEVTSGSSVDVDVFLDDKSNNIQSLTLKWTCDSPYVTVKKVVDPTADVAEKKYKTTKGEEFTANITPFCFSTINSGKLEKNGSVVTDESEFKNGAYTSDVANNRLAYTYTQSLVLDDNGKEVRAYSYLGAKSDEYPLTSFVVEFAPNTPAGNYTVKFIEDNEHPEKSSYCNFYGGEGKTTLDTITFTVKDSSSAALLGDANFDGVVDASDASAVLAAYAAVQTGKNNPLTAEQIAVADVDKSGVVDASDASAILAYYSYKQTGGTISSNEYFK